MNTSDPESRTTYTMQALAYHEAVPGHHLQFALAMEAPGRPAFRRFGYFSAFSEGWGLYSEALPREVGLYTDPYAEMGQLEYSAWRAGRLVVDTGLHHRKWTRDRAIAYLEANTAVPRIEIESEVDRYIAWPGQALAYKIGELKIRELRAAPSAAWVRSSTSAPSMIASCRSARSPWACWSASWTRIPPPRRDRVLGFTGRPVGKRLEWVDRPGR